MIISASRRTDIPAFYFDWFLNRLKEGYALIPNPRNPNRLGKVDLSSDKVDCIVFWTKNPIPMLKKLNQLNELGYDYYIQFTLTPYGKQIERHLSSKQRLLEAFKEMSHQVGKQRSVWRYDPIFIDNAHTISWHIDQFSRMCQSLSPYTSRCILSFIDAYKSISHAFRAMSHEEMIAIGQGFSSIAKNHNISLFTCAEEIDLSPYNIAHASCIDQNLIEQIIGCPITAKKDGNQRAACGCIESVDIGAYDTCPLGCAYCYATSSQNTLARRLAAHDPKSPMLMGYPRGDEIITDRTTLSQKDNQLCMF